MKKNLQMTLKSQSDRYILRGMEMLIAKDRKLKSDFLIYLGEADYRKLYAKEGYSSLFRWLTEKYGFSESSALKRIQVSRLALKFPFLYRDIASGKYTLSALGRLAPFVNGANAPVLFGAAEKKSVRQVEEFLVTQFPKEEVEDRLRKSVSPLGEDRHQVQFTANSEFVSDLEEARTLLSHKPQG
ncbi:hypothetical protein K2X33_11400 [bacterium]|nr:hypothetical protein [bacterium]